MITKNNLLDEVLSFDPGLVTIFERLNLTCKDVKQTIMEASEGSGNNPDFVVELLKAYSNKDCFPQTELKAFSIPCLLDYLKKTHCHYLNKLLPQIEQSINQLIKKFGPSYPDLVLLTCIFLKYKNELEEHIGNEETKLFPYIESLLDAKHYMSSPYSTRQFIVEHDDDGISFPEIRRIIHDNSPSTALPMPYRIFLIQLELFEQDLLIHAKVEDEVLIPKIILLEDSFSV